MALSTLRILRLFLATLIFLIMGAVFYEIVTISPQQQIRKYDEANINHMKYGLFNINTWKEKMTEIVIAEIEDFEISGNNKSDLKQHVESQLSTLIDKVDQQVRQTNKGSTSGWLKQKFIDAVVDVKDIKQGIPNYANSIVEEMTKEDSQKKLKEVIKGRVENYLDQTFEKVDLKEVRSIIKRTGKKNKKQAMAYLKDNVDKENTRLFLLTWFLIGLSGGLFLVSGYHRRTLPPFYFLLCSLSLLMLVYAGVTCPMIDMDAKITHFSFSLLGHKVQFLNQVVYFQSKSIVDVFWILMADPTIQMKTVGILMIAFSIVFPLIKMISSILYYYNFLNSRKRWLVKFFVLKSGKWSMTDVQIVAIMMAYIGFNGMVTSQFNTLRETIPQFELISTNGTKLQIGFYIFLAYVVLSMILAGLIAKKMPRDHHDEPSVDVAQRSA
ncbi:MAG: paraquat-inducible protein A [Bdellovibrionaceae bacterium]|nr:paraquat-inducible protein A [Pseudobdellovibrionaceae bacterium]